MRSLGTQPDYCMFPPPLPTTSPLCIGLGQREAQVIDELLSNHAWRRSLFFSFLLHGRIIAHATIDVNSSCSLY